MIDRFTVIRVKGAFAPDPHHWGSRTDFIVGSRYYQKPGIGFWEYNATPPKRSHGLAAALLAVEKLAPAHLYAIGYDRLFGDFASGKWNGQAISECVPHDWAAEHQLFMSLNPICLSSSNTIR